VFALSRDYLVATECHSKITPTQGNRPTWIRVAAGITMGTMVLFTIQRTRTVAMELHTPRVVIKYVVEKSAPRGRLNQSSPAARTPPNLTQTVAISTHRWAVRAAVFAAPLTKSVRTLTHRRAATRLLLPFAKAFAATVEHVMTPKSAAQGIQQHAERIVAITAQSFVTLQDHPSVVQATVANVVLAAAAKTRRVTRTPISAAPLISKHVRVDAAAKQKYVTQPRVRAVQATVASAVLVAVARTRHVMQLVVRAVALRKAHAARVVAPHLTSVTG
jgi:hypothetical protein